VKSKSNHERRREFHYGRNSIFHGRRPKVSKYPIPTGRQLESAAAPVRLGSPNVVMDIGIGWLSGRGTRTFLRLVLGAGLMVTTFGLGAGAALGVRRYQEHLFDMQPADPITFIAAGALLRCVGLLACYLPTHRAATIDPLNALLAE
jgi:hypothetical protein